MKAHDWICVLNVSDVLSIALGIAVLVASGVAIGISIDQTDRQRPVIVPVPSPDTYAQAVQLIHHRESRGGADPRCRQTGPHGEVGEYQMTPIWLADCERLEIDVDPLDNESCRRAVRAWLAYYAPRVGAETPEDMAELYRRGPSGYRRRTDVRHED